MPAAKHLCRRKAMNTWFECLLLGEDLENLLSVGEAALDEVERIDRLLSRFDPSSEVSRVNRKAADQPVLISNELLKILQICGEYWEKTEGHFDITATSKAVVPEAGFDFSAVQIESHERLVRFAAPSMFLDFGACGKGYALDGAAKILREFGVTEALLHGGTSSVLALGPGEDERAWRVGLRDPWRQEGEIGHVALRDRALSSSAVFDLVQDKSDVIHAPTGQPLASQQGCAVIADSAVEAEAWSTALLGMGRRRATALPHAKHLKIGWIERAEGKSPVTWL